MRSANWFGLALLTIIAAGGATLAAIGAFDRPVEARDLPGGCTPVSGLAGPQDMQIDDTGRRAFIASTDADAVDGTDGRGGIYVFALDDPLAEGAWRDRTRGVPQRFRPLGISYYADSEVRRLFVANAADASVELYDIDENGDLAHLETFHERRLTSPNDVAAVGPRSFYAVNDFEPGRTSLLGRLQYVFRTASGRILYFDGVAWRAAAENLRFPNGVALSRDGRRLYLTETTAAALRVFERDAKTGNLTPVRTVALGVAPNNINVDHSGSLWIGARARTFLPPPETGASAAPSATFVLRYDDLEGMSREATQVFADDGGQISSASVAARLGPTLLIGGPSDKKFLICNLR